MSSSENCRDGLWRTCLLATDGAVRRASSSGPRSRLRVADEVDIVEVEESPERVRARARTVWMVLPDASENGEDGGREAEGEGEGEAWGWDWGSES